jgi:fluoroacetyl-CoA thioesterase
MKDTLKSGLKHRFEYVMPENKTVPHLYPEAPQFQVMPDVLATGYMVGLLEWACIQLLEPHLDHGEGSLGTLVEVTHLAATPPGLTITVDTEITDLQGRRASFAVSAHDGIDLIAKGRHERFIVKWDRFNARVDHKRARAVA